MNGPATIQGEVITFTGTSGTITVKATQAGNEIYYPASATTTFEVVNLQEIEPTITPRFTSAVPLEMPQLLPYLLIAKVDIEEAEQLSIAQVQFNIADSIIEAYYANGQFQAWWRPTNYGEHTVTTTATASNGQQSIIADDIIVTNRFTSQSVKTFDGAVIDWGTIGSQWYKNNYTLPQSVGCYKQIIAHFDVTCPDVPGGCDDWDRLGWVEIAAPNGEWVELFRYITPYGVGCTHSVDVTRSEERRVGKEC